MLAQWKKMMTFAAAVDYVSANCFENDFVADVAVWRYVADY